MRLLASLVAAGGVLGVAGPAFAQYPPPYPPPQPQPPYPPPQYQPPPQGYPPPQYQPPPQGYPPPQYYPPPQGGYQPPPPGYPPLPQGYQPYPQQPYPQPQPPLPPAKRPSDDEAPGWNLDAEAFGGRFGHLGTGGSDGDRHTNSGSFGTYGSSNYAGKFLTARTAGQVVIGGGSGGFEGQLWGTAAIGVGTLVDANQGWFLRGGLSGYIMGNDSFFVSSITFPQGSAGWHLGRRDGYMLEIGGTVAPSLDGRFNVGDQGRRRLGSSGAYGAYIDAFAKGFSFTVEWTRTAAVSQPDTAVDNLNGFFCLASGKGKKDYGFALCMDGRWGHGDVHYGVPATFASADYTYLGWTLGFGFNTDNKP